MKMTGSVRHHDTIQAQANNAFIISRDVASMLSDLLNTTPQHNECGSSDWIYRNDTIKIKVDLQGDGAHTFYISREMFEVLVQTYSAILSGRAHQNAPNFSFDEIADQQNSVQQNQAVDAVILTDTDETDISMIFGDITIDDDEANYDADSSSTSDEDPMLDLDDKLYRLYHGRDREQN